MGKCEKFGYGYMLSQVTATAAGMVALLNTGFVSTLVKSLWGALESVEDSPVCMPRAWSTSDIDKSARKLFLNLVNVLSSFAAVFEILGKKELPIRREYAVRDHPDTVPVSSSEMTIPSFNASTICIQSRLLGPSRPTSLYEHRRKVPLVV